MKVFPPSRQVGLPMVVCVESLRSKRGAAATDERRNKEKLRDDYL